MMLLLLAILLTVITVLLLYCSNKHQRLLAKPLARRWRFAAIACLLNAAGCAGWQLTTPAAVFFILLLIMLALMLVPLMSLLRAERKPVDNRSVSNRPGRRDQSARST